MDAVTLHDKAATATTIYFIRHGQIQANLERVWHGSTDSELTVVGEHQARALGTHFAALQLQLDAIYCSPLKRTRRTAELLGESLGLQPRPDPGLVEYGVGEYEGVPFQTLVDRGFFKAIESDRHYAPSGGESPHQVLTRMVAAIEDLAANHRGAEIAIVSHGASMGLVFNHFLDGQLSPFNKYHMDNTGVSKAIAAEGLLMLYFNNTDHLEQARLDAQQRGKR